MNSPQNQFYFHSNRSSRTIFIDGNLIGHLGFQCPVLDRDIKQSPEKHKTKGIWARGRIVTKEDKRIFQKYNDKAKAFFAGPLLRTYKGSDTNDKQKERKKTSLRALDWLKIDHINVNINRWNHKRNSIMKSRKLSP